MYQIELSKAMVRVMNKMRMILSVGIKEMLVVLDSKFIPMQVRMNQNGKWTSVKISEFAAKNQPDGRFVFNPKYFPSAEVIDSRD
jgi:hypothetical protein